MYSSRTAALATFATALVAGTASASPLLKPRQEYNQNGCYEILQTPLGWSVPGGRACGQPRLCGSVQL